MCSTGKSRGYNIEGDMSPLTKEKNNYTCNGLEVYTVHY
jgi:hypothetical protein